MNDNGRSGHQLLKTMPMDDRDVPRVIILVVMSLVTAVYLCALTVVNVALPQMQGALSATPDQISWVITLNLVATAVATPLTGWLVAKWGQRKVLIWCVSGFSITTYLCATVSSLEPLLIYRIGQGAFGAPLVPIAQAVILNAYKEPDKRAVAMGIWGMSVVIGPGIAPALGGYMAEEYSWRWTFYLLLPVSLAALIGVLAFIRESNDAKVSKLNWTGFIALSIAVTCFQIILDRGERLDWFENTGILVLGIVLLFSFYLFFMNSLYSKNPFIKPQLFTDRNFSLGLFFVFVYGMLNVTPTVLLPTMLQDYVGYPDSDIGFILAMRSVGIFLGFLVAPRLSKIDPRYCMALGLFAIGISGIVSATFNSQITVFFVSWVGVLQGLGCGLLWIPLSLVTFATLRENLMADGTAFFHLIRNYGSSIFIALNVLVVLRTSKINNSELSEIANPYNERLTLPDAQTSFNLDTTEGLISLAQEITDQAVMIGYLNSFILYALGAIIPIPLLALIRKNPPSKES